MNITGKAVPVALIIAIAGISSPVAAQSADIPARGPIPFAAYDRDGNGLVSETEFNTVRGERRASRAAEGRPMRGVASAPSFSAFDSRNIKIPCKVVIHPDTFYLTCIRLMSAPHQSKTNNLCDLPGSET